MSRLDRFWIIAVWGVAGILTLLGLVGLFTGFQLHLTLPPLLGGLPLLLAWALFRVARLAWKTRIDKGLTRLSADGRIANEPRCVGCQYILRGLFPSGHCPECGKPIEESIGNVIPFTPRRPLTERDYELANPPIPLNADEIIEHSMADQGNAESHND